MKNGTRIFCYLLLFNGSLISNISAQDLTGIWRGHFRSNDGLEHLMGNSDMRPKYDDRYKMEVQIAQINNRLEAVTYSYRSTEFYGKAEAGGSFNIHTKKILLKEGKLLEVRVAYGEVCLMTCFLQYSKLGNDEYLQGTYYSVNSKDTLSDCGNGSIFLHRVTETDFHKEPFLEKREKELLAHKKTVVPKTTKEPGLVSGLPKKITPSNTSGLKKQTVTPQLLEVAKKPAPKTTHPSTFNRLPMAAKSKSSAIVPEQGHNTRDSSIKISQPSIPVYVPAVLQTRTNELLKTLTVYHNTVELRIYDDGAIDNDTVSVYYDNKLIVSKARLSDLPITVHIQVEPSEHPHHLVMVAENLGDIPPNTSLLVVSDGEKRYEERIISTEQKNVQINFVYKKIE
jgi:hypothetical protein